MEYAVHLGIIFCLYLILAQSYNLTFGLGRLFNLAHVGVYAVGAYTTALMSTELGAGFLSCVIASTLLGGLLALLIGGISLRLSDEYFAIGSLAFSFVVNALIVNWKNLTRGVLGIPGIPRPELFGIDFGQIDNFLILTAVLCGFAQLALYILFYGSFGRSVRAIAESHYTAQSLGRDVRLIKTLGFFATSAGAGLAGSIFAYYMNYIDPSSFSLHEMVFILTVVVMAGPGEFWKVFLATLFLVVLLPEGLRFLPIEPSILGPLRQMIHGLILFGVLLVNREKIFPVQRLV